MDKIRSMTTVNNKRLRISSPVSDLCTQDDVDQGNPKINKVSTKGDLCNTCFVCDEKDNCVLVCHGDQCPLAMHQSCSSGEPDFDEFGNFYCPYCWYKRVLVKSLKLQKKVMVIDKSSKGREILGVDLSLRKDKETEEIENGVQVSVDLCESRMEVDDAYEEFVVMEKNQRMKEVAAESDSLELSKSCDVELDENNQKQKVLAPESCAREVPRTHRRGRYRRGRYSKKNQPNKIVETETLEKEASEDEERKREGAMERDGDEFNFVENQDRQCQANMRNSDASFNKQEDGFREDDQVERNSVSSSISSPPMSTYKVNGSNTDELALIIHPMAGLLEQPIEAQPIEARPYFSVHRQNSNMEKYGASSNGSRQRSFVSCSDRKRKRLFWTPEEEEMLWVGVQKFPGVKNIPWRKILEYGGDVFQKERLPSDLKDKWKKINKIPIDTGKWVSISTERQPNDSVSE